MNLKTQRIILGSMFAAAAGLPALAYAYDGNSGCRIVLCLANPNGPTSASECKPDIAQMLRDRSKGRTIPSCDEAKKTGTYYNLRNDHYGICQNGFTDSRSMQKGLTGKNVFVLDSETASRLPQRPAQPNLQPQSPFVAALKKSYENNPAVGLSQNGRTALACIPGGSSYTTSNVCLRWTCDGDGHCSCTETGIVHTFNKNVSWNVYKNSPYVADVYVKYNIWHRARLNGDTTNDVRADIEQKYY